MDKPYELSAAKRTRLLRTMNADGVIAALAIDQRGAMKMKPGKVLEASASSANRATVSTCSSSRCR